MGLNESEQIALHALHSTSPGTTAHKNAAQQLTPTYPIVFSTWNGEKIEVPVVHEGTSLMEVAKAAGIESVEGVCGGKLEVRIVICFYQLFH